MGRAGAWRPGWGVVCVLTGLAEGQTVDFNRDVRPIFSDKCFTCHGPDSANRKTPLRFDAEAAAKQDLGGRFAIVNGQPAKSELIRRVTATNTALRMPPGYAGAAALTEREIAVLRRWIEQGAPWKQHWAFVAPRRPPQPKIAASEWPRNPIDHFVLARLEREGYKPAPEAPPETLIRRVTLDLTGLPPTPAEIDAFLQNGSGDAYEKVVDRLLASPRYGERMAARWLDAARYADTNGYQTDAERFMWRWRDWVIEAFNRNLPFDQFTIDQIAGDLVGTATLEQRIATGFNRNHRGNGEGGIVPEEYLVEYSADRVETMSTVWLGLTMGCARCHDHKYDPVTQKEFYRLFAYFNNIAERGRYFKYGNTPPMIPAPTRVEQAELSALEQKLEAAAKAFHELEGEFAGAQESWEQAMAAKTPLDWSISRGLVAPIAGGGAGVFDGKRVVDLGQAADFGFHDKFTLSARIYPAAPAGAVVTKTQPVAEGGGYGLYLSDGKLQVNLVVRWLDDALRVETERPLELGRWHHVLATYDGSLVADGIRIYVDGAPRKIRVLLDELNQNFRVNEPLRIGAGGGPENLFRGRIEEVRIWRGVLTPEQGAVAAVSETITGIAARPPGRRTAAERDKLRSAFLEEFGPPRLREAWSRLRDLREQHARMVAAIPTVMVMEEAPEKRDAFVLVRGAYDRPGEKVTPGTPSVLPPLPPDAVNNRLALAKWLVAPSNPLTARVAVNRFWQMYFGSGLVRTVEDFGSQGEWPSHPELLDWLATEFMRQGWDVKALQKTIVTSATYRQSSRVTVELLEKDPENRLLARGVRLRLPAETVRDQALAISGLLVEKIGGRSVKPYQPAGLWKELSGGEDYKQDHGENLYRRSLYTFWKRTSAPPMMMNFDAASRETCVVRETRTNTPLQALNLMNDTTYLEAARRLGERMMIEGGRTPGDRIGFAFRLATAREPGPAERRLLVEGYHFHLDRYQTDREAARKLISQGESARNESLDAGELAACAAIASLILNLDETIMKQ